MTMLSIIVLVAGLIISYLAGSFAMRSPDEGGTYMPPGMIMEHNARTEQMLDMQAVDERQVEFRAPADVQGDQELLPQIVHGVKIFRMFTSVIRWHILPTVEVDAYAYNHQIPGPRIHIKQGDHVRIILLNQLRVPTTIHWHGLIVPNAMDGPADVTQPGIKPGEAFTYEFIARQSGTYFYHSHDNPDRQQELGLYGALIIDPPKPQYKYDREVDVELGEWLVRNGSTFPSMPMEGSMPNYFTINGKAYPSTPTIHLKLGQKLLVRFIGTSSDFVHPMHIHGGPFTVVALDGNALAVSQQFEKDTIQVAPGERYDVIWPARQRGKWLMHCHINHHVTNDGVEELGGGGLTEIIDVQ